MEAKTTGWPLGLGNLHLKLRLVMDIEEDSQQQSQWEDIHMQPIHTHSSSATPTVAVDGAASIPNPNCCDFKHRNHRRACSSSISTFSSSSSLDTQSTASFFQDKSKSLGKIIGWRLPIKQNSIQLLEGDGDKQTSRRLEDQSHPSPISSLSFRLQYYAASTQCPDNQDDEFEIMAARQPWNGCFPAVYITVCYGYGGKREQVLLQS